MELTPQLLERAYRLGCFPMPDSLGRVRWIQPDPRGVLPLAGFHVSRRLKRTLLSNHFEITCDQNFLGVMQGCANRPETWITDDFYKGYSALHKLGKAHSVEVWRAGKLVGGTYGVHLGGVFFAESKFHTETDASKVALAKLVERLRAGGFALLEVQFLTAHLSQFGVIEIPHVKYLPLLEAALKLNCEF